VKQANASLIQTIEERLDIEEEGRRKRADAAILLEAHEAELRRTLIFASARVQDRIKQQ